MMRAAAIASLLAACGQPHMYPSANDPSEPPGVTINVYPPPCNGEQPPTDPPDEPGDPVLETVTISGPGAIDDTFIWTGSDANAGGNSQLLMGYTGRLEQLYRSLVRVRTDVIPNDGEIVGWRMLIWQIAFPDPWNYSQTPGHMDVFRVAEANAWDEGTLQGFATHEAGAADFFHRAYPEPWAGDIGLGDLFWRGAGGPGVDYDASTEPPSLAYGAKTEGDPVLHVLELPPEWLTEWRDGLHANTGMLLREREAEADNLFRALSADAADDGLSFEVDVIN